jgi:hypothetical protein
LKVSILAEKEEKKEGRRDGGREREVGKGRVGGTKEGRKEGRRRKERKKKKNIPCSKYLKYPVLARSLLGLSSFCFAQRI